MLIGESGRGRVGGRLTLVALDRHGRPVRSFGRRGLVLGPPASLRVIGSARQRDGKIVVLTSGGRFKAAAVYRLTTAGKLDRSFNRTGRARVSVGGSTFDPRALALNPSGAIGVAGTVLDGTDFDAAVARLTPTGQPDPGFGTGGSVRLSTEPQGISEGADAIALRRDGSVIVATTGSTGAIGVSASFGRIARLTARGEEDRTYGAYIPFSGLLSSLMVDAKGRTLVSGGVDTARGSAFFAARFDRAGQVDRTFGAQGSTTVAFARPRAQAQAMFTDRSGRLVLGGFSATRDQRKSAFALVRLKPSGTLDRTFGDRGKVTTPFGRSAFSARALVPATGNTFFAAGGQFFLGARGSNRAAVVRYSLGSAR